MNACTGGKPAPGAARFGGGEEGESVGFGMRFFGINAEVTGAARVYRAASVWTVGLEFFQELCFLLLELIFSNNSVLSETLQLSKFL